MGDAHASYLVSRDTGPELRDPIFFSNGDASLFFRISRAADCPANKSLADSSNRGLDEGQGAEKVVSLIHIQVAWRHGVKEYKR